jgi:signal transduction histidine kinase
MLLPADTVDPVSADAVPALLVEQLVPTADLIGRYHQFCKKLCLQSLGCAPAMLRQIAANQVDALVSFLQQMPSSVEHGMQLCQIGLGEQAVLRLGQAARQFFLTCLEAELSAPALDLVDTYQNGILQGFIEGREKTILTEQERIRSALERAIGRYTVEIKEVQEVALRASEANEFKSRFIARISHELRTPLGALLGMAEMLQENVYGPLTPAQQDITRRIFNNSKALELVFDELLDQSQIESGQLHLRKKRFSASADQGSLYVLFANGVAKRAGPAFESRNGLPHIALEIGEGSSDLIQPGAQCGQVY